MGDKDKVDITDTFVPYDLLTSKTRLLETISELEQDTEGSEASAATSATKTHASWMQRLLRWFRRN